MFWYRIRFWEIKINRVLFLLLKVCIVGEIEVVYRELENNSVEVEMYRG